jgi:hypothetical protein
MNYLEALSSNRADGPEFAATSLTKGPKRAKLSVKRDHGTAGKRKAGKKDSKTPRKPMAKRKKARTAKQKAATAKMIRGNKAARAAKKATGKKRPKLKSQTKHAKRVAAGKKAARTRKRNEAAGKKPKARKARKSSKGRKGGKSGSRSSSRSSHRSSTRVVKQTIVKHVPTGGLLVQAPPKRRAKKRKGGKRKTSKKGKRKGTAKRKGGGKSKGAMENPMTGTELFVGSITGLLGFLTADAVDRLLATHALTDKGTKDASGNELFADNPPTTGSYTGLFNATAICAPMDATRWLAGLGVAGVPLVIAHFISAPMGRSALQFFGFAAGVRIVGKGLIDMTAQLLQTNSTGQRLFDGEMRAAALKANNGNSQAAALASLPSAGLGRTPRLGAPAADCAPCADKQGAGYPSMPREVAPPTTATAPNPNTQMAPPAPPAPPPPPPPNSAVAPNANGLTGPRNGVAGTPKRNRFNWGHHDA